MKRLLSLLTAVCLCLSLCVNAFAADTVLTVTAPETLPAVGESFDVTVAIRHNAGLGAIQAVLAFDKTAVECTSISRGAVLKDVFGNENHASAKGAVFAAASSSPITEDGVLVVCTFKVLKNASPAFALKDIVLSKSDGSPMTHSVSIPYHCLPEAPIPEAPIPETPTEDLPRQIFSDVSATHWAAGYVERAVELGLISGYADETFRPSNQVTRAQFVTMLWRMAGKPESLCQTPFTDIASLNDEFRSAIAWAYEKGYIGGRTATTFAPSDPLSRQAAMKVLFLYSGGNSGGETLFTEIYDDRFTDSSTLASWAKAPMYWAVYNELISGTSPTTLGAVKTATRAQLAKILVNYHQAFLA